MDVASFRHRLLAPLLLLSLACACAAGKPRPDALEVKDLKIEGTDQVSEGDIKAKILTADTPPPESGSGIFGTLTELHHRVPLPMDKATMEAWLDPRADDAAALVDLVRSGARDAAAGWQVQSVGREVGNVRNNGPELIRPVETLF